jgi:hypothetical protein
MKVARLLDINFIKEVYHSNWLTNLVLVPKKNKDWRTCVDYTDLNKACKKDHQIPLRVEDQIKTSLITPFGAFCYTTMPFKLKSVGATYQRGIQRCLHSQIGRNAEAYVDDVVVKTREEEGLISDLAETLDNLRKFKMKLNPERYTFGVPSGKLLGYMVSHHGINPNPKKV